MSHTITEKIERMILNCDVCLVLLTNEGYNSHFVQQEIGYIKSLKKPFLQVIQKGLENKIRGFNYGKDYVQLDEADPNYAIAKVERILMSYWRRKVNSSRKSKLSISKNRQVNIQSRASRIREEQIKRQENSMKIGFGLLATILFFGAIVNND
jgi:hypothetical protein